MILITELSDLVGFGEAKICWELASRGANFEAKEYNGGWRVEIKGV